MYARFVPHTRHLVLRLLAILAMAAQLVLSAAPLFEGRVSSMASHIENAGAVRGHFAHNEATCPVCQARTLQFAAAKQIVPLESAPIRATAVVEVRSYGVFADYSLLANPRAPPSVI
jgi:hypothetical protein